MLSDGNKPEPSGHLINIQPHRAILVAVAFIEEYLVEFSRKYVDSAIQNEKGLTQKLCKLLNYHAKKGFYPFWFDREHMEIPERGDSPQVDIAVVATTYADDKSFLPIETKRLCRLSRVRKKEYLVGRVENGRYRECGGVERFKKGIHGRNHRFAALIGYMQERSFSYWYQAINTWLDGLITEDARRSIQWTEKDKLKKEYVRQHTAKYQSEHSRRQDSIVLFHLWVNLVNKN
jgi:hypothetical protein